jgi:Thioredoxin
MESAPTVQLTKTDYRQYLESGMSYDQLNMQMAKDGLLNTDPKIKEYIRLNQQRMKRIEKTYYVSELLARQVKGLRHKTYWLILTEHWCGDAAQTLPVFQKVAELSSGVIEIKLVYRDENPALMNAYLTGESRSIPKLIQLDSHYNVTGIWGPRPAQAQKLVKTLRSNPETAPSYGTALHGWYAKDKQKSLEAEVTMLLNRASMFCPDCFN